MTDHRATARRPRVVEQLPAAAIRQVNVEQQNLGRGRGQGRPRRGQRAGRPDRMAAALERAR